MLPASHSERPPGRSMQGTAITRPRLQRSGSGREGLGRGHSCYGAREPLDPSSSFSDEYSKAQRGHAAKRRQSPVPAPGSPTLTPEVPAPAQVHVRQDEGQSHTGLSRNPSWAITHCATSSKLLNLSEHQPPLPWKKENTADFIGLF